MKRPAHGYAWETAIETKVRQAVETDSASTMVHANKLPAALVENGIITVGA
jgi:hypothetical protein